MAKKKKNNSFSQIFNLLYISFAITLIIILFYVIFTRVFGSISISSEEKGMVASYNLLYDDIPDPVQNKMAEQGIRLSVAGTEVSIVEIATYDITGKVEAIQDYSSSIAGSTLAHTALGGAVIDKISPRDISLSWGFLARSDENIYDHVTFTQQVQKRYVYWGFDNYLKEKYGEYQIKTHFSNNHIIPKDDHARKVLMSLKVGDIVRVTGYLVEVKVLQNGNTITTWGPSSLVRDDHDCEIIYAEHIVKQKRVNN